ncbi:MULTISPECIES: LysR family transcriptional regulator [Comamonas]|uniref:LysR family transcriptional regulator n=1 Tax=Comamonas TaxID=283 RepID=UPI0015FC2AFD|nr:MULTISPECIES: LysR family transcriptional regulator [Comamonas]UUC94818.1 LysR family transcriptional regulator [Comamonas sp. C11]WEE78857.1 LysR family transcriptional regulator [Comamonas testosteroni]
MQNSEKCIIRKHHLPNGMNEESLTKLLLRKLRLRHFELLSVLSDSESLRVAAERLHLSQPAISKMLKEIESAFGGTLFARSKAGLKPTPAGEVAVRQAQILRSELQVTAGAVLAAFEGKRRVLRLGSLTVTSIVPKAIGHYRELIPGAKVQIREASVDVLLRDLLENNIDCVVGALPLDVASSSLVEGLEVTPVSRDWICMVCSPEHALARRRKVSWQEVFEFDWVLPPSHTMLRQMFVAACLQRGLEPPSATIESMSPLTLTQLLKTDRSLIGVMRREQLRGETSPSSLRVLPVESPIELPTLSFITKRSGSPLPVAVQTFFRSIEMAVACEATPHSKEWIKKA